MDTELEHGRCDAAHCLAPGLFRSLVKGQRKREKLDISYNYGDETLRFIGFEPLGAADLRVLQGIVAMAGPDGILLSPEPIAELPRALRKSLDTRHEAVSMNGLLVRSSLRGFLHEIGLSGGAKNMENLKASLTRISNVNAVVSSDRGTKLASFNLLSFALDTHDDGRLAVALNPRLAAAVLGDRPYCRIVMSEVRAIQSDLLRLIHCRLCGFIDPGKSHRVSLDKLVSYAWPVDSCSAATRRKQASRVRRSMEEMASLPGWRVEEYAKGKYQVFRPSSKAPYQA